MFPISALRTIHRNLRYRCLSDYLYKIYTSLAMPSIELESLGLTHLQSEDAGLRNLAGTEEIDALRTFASALEPVSFGERANAQHTDQLTVLDSFVDALRPDPPSRHWFELAAKRFLVYRL